MLSKSLLQRPDGIVSLKEEFPDDYNFLQQLHNMRGAGDVEAFDAYLQQGEKKYVVSSKIADFDTIKRNLTWSIAQTRRYIFPQIFCRFVLRRLTCECCDVL